MLSYDLPQLTAAFGSEGFKVVNNVRWNGKLGVAAEHRTAFSGGDPQKPKKAFYLEGTHREMGHLLGLMAEEDIAEMTDKFINSMVWELIAWHPRGKADPHSHAETTVLGRIQWLLGDFATTLMAMFNQPLAPGEAPRHLIPPEYLEELDGIVEGCNEATNFHSKVDLPHLHVLNFGTDWILGNVFTLAGLNKRFRLPAMCNGFSLCKAAAGGRHFFGRDFMFPTAGIFGERACTVIYNPEGPAGSVRLPFVSLTAPGMIGSVAGMNRQGVAIGVETVPSRAADVRKVGLNSLVLNRHVVETAGSANAAVDVITNAPRTVPWIYVVADGTNDQACVVETVNSRPDIDFASFPPSGLFKTCLFRKRPLLPDRNFLACHSSGNPTNGVMVRWAGFAYDPAYLDFNKRLFRHFCKKLDVHAHDEDGYFNKTYEKKHCPGPFFFPPQRETRDDVVLTTNHFVIPEMRYTSMSSYLRTVFDRLMQDSQWRYDALNKRILDELAAAGSAGISYATAKEILKFISPDGQYPDYFGADADIIEGAQCLFDLKNLTVESRYGHYGDKWVTMGLKKYVP